jgi:hypothetical protein
MRRGEMEMPAYRTSVWNKRPRLGRLKLRKQAVRVPYIRNRLWDGVVMHRLTMFQG